MKGVVLGSIDPYDCTFAQGELGRSTFVTEVVNAEVLDVIEVTLGFVIGATQIADLV